MRATPSDILTACPKDEPWHASVACKSCEGMPFNTVGTSSHLGPLLGALFAHPLHKVHDTFVHHKAAVHRVSFGHVRNENMSVQQQTSAILGHSSSFRNERAANLNSIMEENYQSCE
jgi:hypothetical protein